MPTTGTPKGELYRITIGGTKVGHATSSGIDQSLATQEISSKDTGGGAYTETIAAKISWTMPVEFLFNLDATIDTVDALTYEDLHDLFSARAAVAVKITTGVTGDTEYTGNALITALSSSFPNDEVATGSCTLTGVGALSTAVIA